MKTLKLAIIEDDPVIVESLRDFLTINPGVELKLVANSVEECLSQLILPSKQDINIVLLDIGLPGMSGLQGIRHIRQKLPAADIIMLTTFEEQDIIFKALCAGACSYISKRTSLVKIREAIFTVHQGGSYMSPFIARKIAAHFMPVKAKAGDALTPRQQQIVDGLVDGLSYKLIADKLSISIDTVRDHIRRIYRTLEVNSKAEVIRKALKGEI